MYLAGCFAVGIIINDAPQLQMAWAEGELYVLSLHCNNKLTVIFREKEEAEFPAKKKKRQNIVYFAQDNK